MASRITISWQQPCRMIGLAACICGLPTAASATSYLFEDVYQIGEYLADDIAKPVIADNGTVAFLNVENFATNEQILAVDSLGNVYTILDSTGPIVPLNSTGPGISDNGQYVAYSGRQVQPGGFPIDRIYRQSIGAGLPVEIAGPGSITSGFPGDTIGAVACRFNCNVLNDGSVYFSTLSPTTLSWGDGGDIQTFAIGGATGLHDYFRQSNNGFRAAVLEVGSGQEFVIGTGDASLGNVFLDTSGEYDGFRFPNVTDQATIAIIGDRDSGGQDILTRITGEVLAATISTSGAFKSFDRLSVNNDRELVFLAELDVPSGESIYIGPDPLKHRLLGPGDQLFGKLVVNVELAPYDAINDNGQITMAVRFSDDTARIVRAAPITEALITNSVAVLASGGLDSSPSLSSLVQLPSDIFDLSFDFNFLEGDGVLEVLLGPASGDRGSILGRFTPDMAGLAEITGIDPTSIFGADLPQDARLTFRLSGGPGIWIDLDNITMPGLVNGDFETGYLDGWIADGDGSGIVAAIQRTTPAIPSPPVLSLLLGGFAGVYFFAARSSEKRRKPVSSVRLLSTDR